MTSSCSSGGKAPRPTRTRSILQTRKAVLEVAGSPENHGVATVTEFIRDLQIGWLVLAGKSQDRSATKGQCLRRGMRSRESFQPLAFFRGQDNWRSKWTWHDRHPCRSWIWAIYQLDLN